MSLIDYLDDQDATTIEGLVTPAEFREIYFAHRPERVAFDTEATSFKWALPWVVPFALTFSWSKEHTYYVPCAKDRVTDPEAVELLYQVLATAPEIVCHNTKFDLHIAKKLFDEHGYPLVVRQIHDTMLLSHVLDENRYHGLKELCTTLEIRYSDDDADVLKGRIAEWIETQGKMTGTVPGYDEVPLRLMVPYAMQDAYLTLELFRYFATDMELQLERQRAKRDIRDIYELELRLLWVIFAMEERGMRIDLDFVVDKIGSLTPTLEHDQKALAADLGFEINPLATDDVAKALVMCGREDALWTNPKTGKINLPEWRLQELIDDPEASDLVKRVLGYRSNSKMLNSYYEPLMVEHAVDQSGQAIVRCNVKQTAARTGRQSVTEPALQTIPRDKGDVRGAFIAREGHSLIFADYAQQELRVLAHYMELMGDSSVADIFRSGETDFHQETAAAMFQREYDEVTKEERRHGKNTNFAIVYGAGVKKIAAMHGVDDVEAKARLNRMYRRFPGLQKLKRSCETAMRNREYVVTAFGRRHREKEGRFAYKAVNSLVQGTSADMTKWAEVKIDDAFRRGRLHALIVLSVHDEIIVEVPDEEVEEAVRIIVEAMQDMPEISVPMMVDPTVATRWSEAKE